MAENNSEKIIKALFETSYPPKTVVWLDEYPNDSSYERKLWIIYPEQDSSYTVMSKLIPIQTDSDEPDSYVINAYLCKS